MLLIGSTDIITGLAEGDALRTPICDGVREEDALEPRSLLIGAKVHAVGDAHIGTVVDEHHTDTGIYYGVSFRRTRRLSNGSVSITGAVYFRADELTVLPGGTAE